MSEKQNIEYKQNWKDEWLKWISGFANAQGGKLYIGLDDNGNPTGQLANSKKLMEDIPNKVKDKIGIFVNVNQLEEDGKQYIEIDVKASPFPVNYDGEYFVRSGATNQQLTGQALNYFISEKLGIKWDGAPIQTVSVKDFNNDAFLIFREKALSSKRMSEADLELSNEELLEKLGLLESGVPKRAAVLLFHQNPEKWVFGAYIKVGFFTNDADILYQDEVHGSLLSQVDKTMDLIYTKYLTAPISYEGIQRVDNYPFPYEGVREALLNAIGHKDYSSGIPIQISVYKDKIYIANNGSLPNNWTIESLKEKHKSEPFNPLIANTFYKTGMIESWGRGIEKIQKACEKWKIPFPTYTLHPGDIMIMFENKEYLKILDSYRESADKTTIKDDKTTIIDDKKMTAEERIIKYVKENGFITTVIVKELFGVKDTKAKEMLRNMVTHGLIVPEGANRNRKYRLP